MANQTLNLNLIPDSIVRPRALASQFDVGRVITFSLYQGNSIYTPPTGTHIEVRGKKADHKIFVYNESDGCIALSGSTITLTTTQQMTAAAGEALCQFKLTLDETVLATLNFVLVVQIDPAADGDISKSELPAIIAEATAQMEAAELSAQHSLDSSLDSEAYAKGTRGGIDVPSTDEAYENNSKYFSERAGESAVSAYQSKSDAIIAKNESESARDRSEAAASAAESWSQNPPYIGANGNWFVYDIPTQSFVDSGVDASITVDIADITMLDPDATPYITNTGTNTDPIFHLFIPRGKGITSIEKTSSSGLVDTYTITYSDGTTYPYYITNGKTAYQSAIEGGYEKSEAEFYNELGNFDELAQSAEESEQAAKGYAEEAEDYYRSLGGAVLFQGSIMFSELPLSPLTGWLYNIKNAFVTDSRFVEGAGIDVDSGAYVAYTDGGKWCITKYNYTVSFDDSTDTIIFS